MDTAKLATVRNAVESEHGKAIIEYLQDKIINYSTSTLNSECIKGMCILLGDLKNIQAEYEGSVKK